jgi:formate/nitrite transporter FocA (FNT family)
MAKEKLEDLSSEQLKKRKKFAYFIMGICAGVSIFSIVMMLVQIVKGKFESISSFIPGIVLIMFVGIMFMGAKKIDEELARRNDK